MADTSVVVQMSAQDADLVAAWQRARRGPQGMAEELGKVKQKGKEAGDSMQEGFLNAAKAFTGVGSAMGAALAVSRLIRSEWQAIIDRMREAANRQVDVNQAFRKAASASGEISPDQLYERVVRGANGVDPKELFLAYEQSIGSAGNIPAETVLQTLLSTAKLRPEFDLASRSATIRASLQLQKSFGVKPQEATAGVLQAFVADSTQSAEDFANNLAPAVSSLRALGGDKDSFEFLMSELIGFGQRSGDPHGRKTATNYINLARQYKERAIAAGHVDKNASLEESLNAVRKDPKIQQLMLTYFAENTLGVPMHILQQQFKQNRKDMGGEEMSIEGRMFVAGKETLQKNQGDDNKTAVERRAAQGKLLGLTPAAVADIEGRNAVVEDSKYSQAAGISRGSRQSTALAELLDTPSAIKSKAYDSLFDALKKSGVGPVRRGIQGTILSAYQAGGEDTDASAADFVAQTAGQLRSEIAERRTHGQSESNERNIKVLEEALRGMQATLERLNATLSNPQKVIIKGDERADAPKQAAAKGIGDDS